MSVSWLQRQRKQTLLDLSTEAGLSQSDDLRKDELIEALDSHLRANATRLSSNTSFQGYYGGRSSTPFRMRASVAPPEPTAVSSGDDAVKSAVKARGRKPTKVKQEPEDSEAALSSPLRAPLEAASSAIATTVTSIKSTTVAALLPKATQTPAPPRRLSQLPGPPSPSVVADAVEQEVTQLTARASKLYAQSGISENIDYLRELCSSVAGVHMTILLLEALSLQQNIMPWKYAFDLPAVPALRIPSHPVSLPDMFVILTGEYWSTTLLWAATSILVPALFGYFYNLTIREVKRGSSHVNVPRYSTDPLTFNVVKALTTWLVYAQGISLGLFSESVAKRVDTAIAGGHTAVLIGSGIGILAALYDAALKK